MNFLGSFRSKKNKKLEKTQKYNKYQPEKQQQTNHISSYQSDTALVNKMNIVFMSSVINMASKMSSKKL